MRERKRAPLTLLRIRQREEGKGECALSVETPSFFPPTVSSFKPSSLSFFRNFAASQHWGILFKETFPHIHIPQALCHKRTLTLLAFLHCIFSFVRGENACVIIIPSICSFPEGASLIEASRLRLRSIDARFSNLAPHFSNK